MADMLRSVPGMNVIQMSARDINLTARQATSTLATSQLVPVDGRSVYLDFFGLVLWDLVPSPTSGEIKQIEVVRGPASVVWGANAVNGVVNIITKTPRENEGFGLVLGGGLFDRDGGSREADGNGYQFNGGFSYANAINDTLVVPAERRLLQLRPLLAADGHASRSTATRSASCRAAPRAARGRRRRPDRRRRVPAGRGPAGRLRERRDQPAQVRPAGRPGLREAAAASPTRAATPAPRASSTPGIGPFGIAERLVHGLRRACLHARAPCDQRLRQLPGRRGAEPAARSDPDTLGPISPGLQDPDLRLRDRQHERAGRQAHPHLRRQRPPQQLRHLARARAETAPSSAPTASGSTSSTSSASPPAAASTSSATSRTRSSRRASA